MRDCLAEDPRPDVQKQDGFVSQKQQWKRRDGNRSTINSRAQMVQPLLLLKKKLVRQQKQNETEQKLIETQEEQRKEKQTARQKNS